MVKSRDSQLIQRLWSEHKYALVARSPSKARELGRRLSIDGLGVVAAADAIEELMAEPESHLEEALAEAWAHLQPRVGMAARESVEGLLKKDPEAARWLMGGLAESVGDGVVASSRLLDHPAGCRRVWLRDNIGPTMYEILSDGPVRHAPAEIGRLLVATHGRTAWKALRLLAEKPQTPSEMGIALGPAATKVLEAGHRILMLRRVGGHYRSRGTAVGLVLAGLGR